MRSRNSRMERERENRPKKQTYCKRKGRTQSIPHARDWCTPCMMGRGRTHHSVEKRSEDLPRRPMKAMDYSIRKPTSIANSQTIPDVSGTCIAVTEDRHLIFLSSVVLKKRVEEFWASERVAIFINSLGYKEITLKSDTERAMQRSRWRTRSKERKFQTDWSRTQ